mmetsp:Transcript_67654/g.135876  ORF Transcript_67654/g.135876 Transcript_67654/m.135876 type:complete len:247 (+) Transcript_67654:71-811(+)
MQRASCFDGLRRGRSRGARKDAREELPAPEEQAGSSFQESSCSASSTAGADQRAPQPAEGPCTMLLGSPAPSFGGLACMPDAELRDVQLADFAGRYLLLLFYPQDFKQVPSIPGLDALLEELELRECAALGCSTDAAEAHQAWRRAPQSEGGISTRYPLLGDPLRETARSFRVLSEASGRCVHAVFLFDRHGVVQLEHRSCHPPTFGHVLAQLDALRATEPAGIGRLGSPNAYLGEDAGDPFERLD